MRRRCTWSSSRWRRCRADTARGRDGALLLHGGIECGGSGNFDVYRLYPLAGTRFGVRAIDLAGHKSAPSEVTLQIDPPGSDPYRR